MVFDSKRALSWLYGSAFVFWLLISLLHINNDFSSAPYQSRPAQTLISSYWMVQEGIKINYDTPILGAPWKIPLEFPVYQILVALLAKLGVPLIWAGHIVSMVFAIAILPLLAVFCRTVKAVPGTYKILAILYLTSPIYMYWSGTVMIESTALFFTLAFMTGAFYMMENTPERRKLFTCFGLVLASGILAMLTKATTFIPGGLVVGAIGGLLTARELSRPVLTPKLPVDYKLLGKIFVLGFVTISAVGVGAIWVDFADGVKSQSEFTAHLTSKRLHNWNWGRMKHRLEPDLYVVIWTRVMPAVIGYCFLITMPLIAWALISKVSGTEAFFSRNKLIILSAVLAYLSGFALFPTLHIKHSYYQVANGIFLIIATSFALSRIKLDWLKFSVLGLLVGGNMFVFFQNKIFPANQSYFKIIAKPTSTSVRDAGEWIAKSAGSDDRVLVFGVQWGAHFHYYAERKGMALAGRYQRFPDLLKKALDVEYNDYSWVVDCTIDKSPKDSIYKERTALLSQLVKREANSRCDIYEVPES